MRIGLIDVDGHNFPNLPLMKLSAWHKAQGDSVEYYQPLFSGHMDRVYMSKVFSFTPDYPYPINADKIIGGVEATPLIWKMAKRFFIQSVTTIFPMRSNTFIRIIACIRSTKMQLMVS